MIQYKDPLLSRTAQKDARSKIEKLQTILLTNRMAEKKLTSVLLVLTAEILAKKMIKRDDVIDISFNLLTELEHIEKNHPSHKLPADLQQGIQAFCHLKNIPLQLKLTIQKLIA